MSLVWGGCRKFPKDLAQVLQHFHLWSLEMPRVVTMLELFGSREDDARDADKCSTDSLCDCGQNQNQELQ